MRNRINIEHDPASLSRSYWTSDFIVDPLEQAINGGSLPAKAYKLRGDLVAIGGFHTVLIWERHIKVRDAKADDYDIEGDQVIGILTNYLGWREDSYTISQTTKKSKKWYPQSWGGDATTGDASA